MAGGRFSLSTLQELSNAGLLQSGSRLRFRPAGSTTTLQDTYSNPSLTTPNANPVVADSYGRFGDIFLSDLAYRVEVLPPSGNDTPVFTFDPVYKDRVIIQAAAAPANPWPDMEYVNTTDLRRYRRNRANSAWVDLGPYDSVGNTASISDVIAASSSTLFVTPAALKAIWGKGTDIASATTLTLPASEGGLFVVTGNTTITGIAATTEGRRIALYFTGTPLLDDGASFDLGGQDRQMVAGSLCEFIYYNSIWYLVDIMYSAVAMNVSKTGDYTATDADLDGIIVYDGMSADRTLTLPAAAGRAGRRITLVVNDTTYGVTVDGNAAEQVDGQATRKTFGRARITLFCTGTGWITESGDWIFVHGPAALTLATTVTAAHNQPKPPHSMQAFLQCVTTDGGYAVGDRILIGNQDSSTAASNSGFTWGWDASNLFMLIGSGSIGRWFNKSTGVTFTPTLANWQAYLISRH